VEKFVKAFNEDGRDFIRASVRRMREWHVTEKKVEIPAKKSYGHGRKKYASPVPTMIPIPETISHFVMNLPATAIEFVDAFRGIYRESKDLFEPITDTPLPMIHVYCFQNPKEAEETILKEVREALGFEIDAKELSIHNVRNVSPNKVHPFLIRLTVGYVL
jgi:tRNA (guanine37-N1)-methyltransferase